MKFIFVQNLKKESASTQTFVIVMSKKMYIAGLLAISETALDETNVQGNSINIKFISVYCRRFYTCLIWTDSEHSNALRHC